MKNKKILALSISACLGLSSLLYGCGASNYANDKDGNLNSTVNDAGNDVKDKVQDAGEDVKNSVKDAGEDIKNGTENIIDNVKDTTMTYDEDDFENDLRKNNVKVEDVDGENYLFSVGSDDYLLNGQRISVYEYDSDESQLLNNDIASIADKGNTINGKKVTWNAEPHIYKKGRIVVVYDGNDSSTLTTLKNILGDPILG